MKVFRKKLSSSKGFTLVELLVVLAIIGILVGLAIAGIRIVQQMNRDTQRKVFTRDLQLLLEAHQESKNKYPTGTGALEIVQPGTTHGCGDNEVYIATKEGLSTIEHMCSRINFETIDKTNIGPGKCTGFAGAEAEAGRLTFCFDGDAGYHLMVKVERSLTPYDASNKELPTTP